MSPLMKPVPESAHAHSPGPRSSPLGWLDWLTGGNRLAKVLLVFPAASGGFTLGTMLYMAGFFDPSYDGEARNSGIPASEQVSQAIFTVVFSGFNLLPAAALVVLISLTARRFPAGLPVTAVGCLAFTAATAWADLSIAFDESSTAAIGLLFLPPALGLLLSPFAGGAVLVHVLRTRRASR